ncbi:hypothetical protein D3C76_423940 [compost metagenome]
MLSCAEFCGEQNRYRRRFKKTVGRTGENPTPSVRSFSGLPRLAVALAHSQR